jgi:Uncharacterized membrane protein
LKELLIYSRDINMLSILIRTTLSLIIGSLLGIERGRKNRPAGFRTHVLVCFGAALVMMTNQYVSIAFGGADPVRMGAQVISGIGFLGAGTIITTNRNQVKGMTTAAGLWAAACCGLTIGIGFYEGAVVGGLVIFFVMSILRRVDQRIHRHMKSMDYYIELDSNSSFGEFVAYIREAGIEMSDIQMSRMKLGDESIPSAILTLTNSALGMHGITKKLAAAPGVVYLEEIG